MSQTVATQTAPVSDDIIPELWADLVERLLTAAASEARAFAVCILRKRWGRLGNLLKRHPWAIEYRGRNFVPVWYHTVVKRWRTLAILGSLVRRR